MGKVVAGATVSLDGYVAGPNESGFEHLFAWFDGDVELPSLTPGVTFRLTEPDYRYFRDVNEGFGVQVIGRRLFDLTDGWGGRHPFDKPIVVVTHSVPVALGRRSSRRALHIRHRRAARGPRAGEGDRGRSERQRHGRQDREPVPGAGPAR